MTNLKEQRIAIERLVRSYEDREAIKLNQEIIAYQKQVVARLAILLARLESEEIRQ